MKLLLTSSGISNKSIAGALAELVARPFPKLNIVFIPTAATILTDDKHWLVKDMQNAKELGFKNFYITDIGAVPKKIWLPQIEQADVIMVGGGDTEYLYDCLEKSGLSKMISDFLKSKVYVGVSAGSIVAAKQIAMSSAGILYHEKTYGISNRKGLGLVPFEIRPHLNSEFFPKVNDTFLTKMAKKMSSPFYAIDDNSAVKVVNKKVEVVSEGNWKLYE